AAEPHEEHRAALRIALDADDQLYAAFHHLLHQKPVLGRRHGSARGPNFVRGLQVELHRAGLGLVLDLAVGLEHDRVTELLRSLVRLVRFLRVTLGGGLDAVFAERRLRRSFAENFSGGRKKTFGRKTRFQLRRRSMPTLPGRNGRITTIERAEEADAI